MERNGYVVGVAYENDLKSAKHLIITNREELELLKRSKFVQSFKKQIYKEIKYILKKGNLLLFVGTPCEVGGLRTFLKKEYSNLYTCDLICGCVSSPKVLGKYIDNMELGYGASAVSLNFKDKRSGWREKGVSIQFSNGKEYFNTLLDDDYVVSFHSRLNIRPSCLNVNIEIFIVFQILHWGTFGVLKIMYLINKTMEFLLLWLIL